MFDKVFEQDVMSKRERVLATLLHQPVDRVAILEQLSYNPRVIARYTGKTISGFDYTVEDIYHVICQTTDLIMPAVAPKGTGRETTVDGLVIQHDNWNSWHVGRPFHDEIGARDWLQRVTRRIRETPFDASVERGRYRTYMVDFQRGIGDSVILNFSATGLCYAFDSMGLDLFVYFYADYPEVFTEYMQASISREVARVRAVADPALSPVILVPEDFASKRGPIFSPAFLHEHHYPHLRRLTEAWHEAGVTVLYHSDGNWKIAIPDLIACGVDGFYCLEPACGMDIVELKNTWPQMVWAGGVDGVDLMERGTPEQVQAEVRRHIVETNALQTGGMFVASSSEINPPIPPENFAAMIEAVGALFNPQISQGTNH
jgi:uroporphyrinogen decarboxylase